MFRRMSVNLASSLTAFAIIACTLGAASQTCTPTTRKGVATYIVAGSPNSIDNLAIHWWYDWSPNQRNYGAGYTGSAIYVPEFWDSTSTNLLPLSQVSAATASPWVFTFNEPDVGNQSDMTVSQALTAWPTVEADAENKLIGAPDIAIYSDGWLGSFMTSAASDSYPTNFLTLHEYPEGNGTTLATQVFTFEDYIVNVHDLYPNLPIVVNEFALVNRTDWNGTGVTTAEQVAFLQQVVPWLESQSYIWGYAWFAAYEGYYNSDLLNSDGSLSTIGTAYSQVGCVNSAIVPSNPSTTQASYSTETGFTANWVASSGANQYVIWLFDANFNLINPYYVGNLTSQPISGLSANTSYNYCVTAGNAAGFSRCGNSTAVTTNSSGGSVPSEPTTQAASALTTSGFTANWSSVSGASSYIIYEFNSNYHLLNSYSTGNVTSFAVTQQASDTEYYYCVAAGNTVGFSQCANTVSVTTQ